MSVNRKKKLTYKFTVEEIISNGKTNLENINEIKNWLSASKESFLPIEIQEEIIVLFLLSCDNDLDLTKKTAISHFKIKMEAPELFNQRKMAGEDIQKTFRTLKLVCLPGRTADNNAVIYLRTRDTSYRNFEIIPTMKATSMLMDVIQETNPPNGVIYLIDMAGFGMMHLTKIRWDPLKKYFAYLGEGLPMKFVGIHFLNSNYVLERFMAMVRKFLQPNLMKRLHMHPRGEPLEELFKTIPKKCLPQELGGELKPEEKLCEETINLLNDRQQFWDVEEDIRKK